jgi:hypothetical protein
VDWKKRGIQLKSLRPDDPGHLNLCRDPSMEDEAPWSAALDGDVAWDTGAGGDEAPEAASEQTAPPDPTPDELSRAIREELEEALDLLDDVIDTARPIPLRN